jgi:glycosyltransferase involved in cell wall biosynthesis
MELCLTLDHRFHQTPDGRAWTVTQCAYPFFSEYLEVFDSVRVIGRSFPASEVGPNFLPVEGPAVGFFAMPSYKGPYQFLANSLAVARRASEAIPNGSAVLFRVPSQVANSVAKPLRARNHPYAVEVVADPYDVFSPSADPRIVAPVARRYFTRNVRSLVKNAVAVSYVTQTYLQQRYPPVYSSHSAGNGQSPDPCNDSREQFVIGVSDANLSDDAFCHRVRTRLHDPSVLRVVFVGTLGSLYKGPDTLIRAVAACHAQLVRVEVRFAGDGREKIALQLLCRELNISDRVDFLGDVQTGRCVREELDRADVFVLPSRAEGVPRAMLEAMARSLPCIGSTVGGIPELLHSEDLVPPDDAGALAAQLIDVYRSEGRIQRMSERNLLTAGRYTKGALSARRKCFLEALRERTQKHFAHEAACLR